MTAALAAEHVTFWWITLGLGLVVILVVVVLMMLLTSFVKDVDRAVGQIWEEAAGVATQTASTWMLANTAGLAGQLRDETRLHAELLGDTAGLARAGGGR
jgi:hypothetical protein